MGGLIQIWLSIMIVELLAIRCVIRRTPSTDGYGKDWVQVDVGQTVIVTSYEIENRVCKDMRFYYSTDGSNWTQVREWTGLSSHTNLGPYTTSLYGRYLDLPLMQQMPLQPQ